MFTFDGWSLHLTYHLDESGQVKSNLAVCLGSKLVNNAGHDVIRHATDFFIYSEGSPQNAGRWIDPDGAGEAIMAFRRRLTETHILPLARAALSCAPRLCGEAIRSLQDSSNPSWRLKPESFFELNEIFSLEDADGESPYLLPHVGEVELGGGHGLILFGGNHIRGAFVEWPGYGEIHPDFAAVNAVAREEARSLFATLVSTRGAMNT
jgi:hypothetical protein